MGKEGIYAFDSKCFMVPIERASQKLCTFSGTCHLRDRVGYKHRFQDITQSFNVQDLIECSDRCQRLGFCRSFSYMYSNNGFGNSDNCLLSSIYIEDVDYVSDTDWDLYELLESNLCGRRTSSYYQGGSGLLQQLPQTLQGKLCY